jgi:hypothetical protein
MLLRSYAPPGAVRAANARARGATPKKRQDKANKQAHQGSGGFSDDPEMGDLTTLGGSKVSKDADAVLANIAELIGE